MKSITTHSDNNLTFENASSLGYSWREDIKKLELLSSYEREIYEFRISEWDLAIGQPSNGDIENFIGLYDYLLPELEVDETLTPETAEGRGYIWVGETMYSREAPLIAMQGTIDAVQKEGYKLGLSASSNTDLHGLYAPIEK